MKQYNNYTADDFTFVVCAYQECEYLEEAIRSVKEQTISAKILISTSTPNDFIQGIADRYDIPVCVNRTADRSRTTILRWHCLRHRL